ncbi:MAG: cysteine peptidase family C39 domain-containing protein [Bacteriovoracaceae bacterium]
MAKALFRAKNKPSRVNLRLPYVPQGKESGNCGPCSLKMIADYYGLKKKTGEEYSVPSLNRLCHVTKEWGCEKSDMNRVMKRLGLKKEKVTLRNISRHLARKKPVLSLIIDESGIGHYAVIKGVDQQKIIFHDSYWGKNFKRPKKSVQKQAKPFQNWMWALSPQ